jgi:glycerol-3-phosphate cytidylyltransferase
MVRGITFGTFDLFHIGHVNILRRAREQCDFLIVGVSTDKLNYDKKKVYPVINESERSAIVESCRYVDQVFFEHSLDLKVTYIQEHRADVLFMGDDWAGRFDFCSPYCRVVYFPRTPLVSSSNIRSSMSSTPRK